MNFLSFSLLQGNGHSRKSNTRGVYYCICGRKWYINFSWPEAKRPWSACVPPVPPVPPSILHIGMILPPIHSAYRNDFTPYPFCISEWFYPLSILHIGMILPPIHSAYRNCSPHEMCCSTSQQLRCYKLNNFFSQLTVCNLHQMNSGSKARFCNNKLVQWDSWTSCVQALLCHETGPPSQRGSGASRFIRNQPQVHVVYL